MKTFFKHRIVQVMLAVVVIWGGYYAYGVFRGSGVVVPQYVTKAITHGTLVVSVMGSGQVTDSNQTNIQAKSSGNVAAIYFNNNQKVAAGDILFRLDTTNEDRSVRNTQVGLQSAELALQSLKVPASTSTLLQSQNAVAQAKQSFETSNNNLAADYNNSFTDISNTFIDLPNVVNGLNTILYATTINKVQGDIDAYTSMVGTYYPNVIQYNQSVASSYQTAFTAYNQNLADYKSANVYSSTSTIESLLAETYNTLQAVSVANSNTKNLLDLVNTTLQQNQQRAPAQLTIDEASIQSYITTTNSHISTILQIQNSLATDKQAIASANLSMAQTAASLDQLKSGPTALQIQSQELSVTQAKNALADAQANLENDYVRAPFTGIITNIAAKIGQPAPATLAVLIGNQQLAQATFNEIDIVNVNVGQPATITFNAMPNLTLTGKVSQVDTLGTVSQGVVSYNAQVVLDVPNQMVKPGMSDSIAIVTKVKQDVLLVPSSAVSTKQGVSSVKVMASNGVPTATQVTVGLSNDTMTEILSGLNEGDNVVTQTITKAATPAQTTQNSGIRIPGFGGVGGGGRGN